MKSILFLAIFITLTGCEPKKANGMKEKSMFKKGWVPPIFMEDISDWTPASYEYRGMFKNNPRVELLSAGFKETQSTDGNVEGWDIRTMKDADKMLSPQ